MGFDKTAWSVARGRRFAAEHGYSAKAHYATGGLREQILERDGHRCVRCGMTDAEHRARWGRPITIDHIDRNRSRNTEDNLQTLCLSCHGRKDISPALIEPKALPHRDEIMRRRKAGETYQQIADAVGISIGAAYKWIQRWNKENVNA